MAAEDPERSGDQRVRRLEARVAELEERLRAVELQSGTAPFQTQPAAEPTPSGLPRMSPPTEPKPGSGAAYAAAESFWPPRAVTAPTPTATSVEAPRARPPAEPPRVKKAVDLEQLLGANWLAKAGMVVLVLGAVFFLKFAFDQGWVNRPARIVLGVVGGLVLALLGDRLRQHDRTRFDVYGQVLAGGGVVITAFSLFAAYQFPRYRAVTGMTLELDALLLALLTLGLAAYATARRTPVLATQAILLAALVSRFGSDWDAFTVAFTLLFALAVSAAAVVRQWPRVLEVALFAAFVTFALDLSGDVEPRAVLAGATLLALGGTAAAAWRTWRPALLIATLGAPWVMALALRIDAAPSEVLATTLMVAAGGLAAAWWRRVPILLTCTLATFAVTLFARVAGLGLVTTGVALGGVAVAAVAVAGHRRWPREVHYPLVGGFVALFAALEVGLGPWTTYGPAVGVALAAYGVAAWRRMPLVMVVAAVAPAILFARTLPMGLEPVAAVLALGGLGVVGLALAGWRSWERAAHGPVVAALAGLLLGLGDLTTWTALSAGVAVAVAATLAASAKRWPYLLVSTVIVGYVFLFGALRAVDEYVTFAAGLAIFTVVAASLMRMPAPAERGVIAGLAAGSLLAVWALGLGALELRERDAWQGPATAAFALLGIALAALRGASAEARAGWGGAGALVALAWPPIQFDGSAPISVAWTAMAAVALAVLRARPNTWTKAALLAAVALATLWTLGAVAADIADGTVSPFVGVFPFALGTAVLFAAWLVYAAATARGAAWEAHVPRFLLGTAVLMPLVYFGTAMRGYGISIAWAAEGVALLVAGFVFSMRDLRLGALAVFALTVGRVFLVDLTDLGVEVRIVTFLVVGALLLLASYLYARRRATPALAHAGAEAEPPREKG